MFSSYPKTILGLLQPGCSTWKRLQKEGLNMKQSAAMGFPEPEGPARNHRISGAWVVNDPLLTPFNSSGALSREREINDILSTSVKIRGRVDLLQMGRFVVKDPLLIKFRDTNLSLKASENLSRTTRQDEKDSLIGRLFEAIVLRHRAMCDNSSSDSKPDDLLDSLDKKKTGCGILEVLRTAKEQHKHGEISVLQYKEIIKKSIERLDTTSVDWYPSADNVADEFYYGMCGKQMCKILSDMEELNVLHDLGKIADSEYSRKVNDGIDRLGRMVSTLSIDSEISFGGAVALTTVEVLAVLLLLRALG